MSLDFDWIDGGGGGSGGQTIQYDVMPTPAMDSIIQYTGETDANYTQGYFYQGTFVSSSASISQTAGTGLTNIAVDKNTFETQIDSSGNYVFSYNNGWKYDGASVTLSDYGISYTETNTLSVSQTTGNDLGTVSANQTTWENQVSDEGTYIFTYDGTNWKLGNTNVSLSTYGISYTATSTQDSATGSQTSGSGITNIAVNVSMFKSAVSAISGSPITTGNYVFTYNGTTWKYGQSDVNMPSLGITFTEPSADFNTSPSGAVDGYVSNQQLWESKITQSGTYTFVYSENDGWFHANTISGPAVDLYEYGISWGPMVAVDPETTVDQTVGDLTIEVDPWGFSGYFSDAADDYTFTFNGSEWSCEGSISGPIDPNIDLTSCGITIYGTPQSGYTFIVSLTPPIYGPLDGDSITVEYTKGMQSGDAITVAYTQGITVPATGDAITAVYVRGVDNGDELTVVYERTYAWQQINVQPAPEIATQETVGGNTELSADTGVLVIATPDGTEDKQVANVEYVNNIVGTIETALSEI